MSSLCCCWPVNLYMKAVFIVMRLPSFPKHRQTSCYRAVLSWCFHLFLLSWWKKSAKVRQNMTAAFYIILSPVIGVVFCLWFGKTFFFCFFKSFLQALCLDQVPWHTKLCTKLHKSAWASHSALVSYQWPLAYWLWI